MKVPLPLAIALLQCSPVLAQSDSFDDGDADGWSKLDPLSDVGATGVFSFPDGNSYRLQGAITPDQGAAGPSRIGALREDVTYSDFYLFVDLIDYDQDLDQNIGLLARVKEPGLGTLDGYSFSYNPTDQMMFFSIITDEQGTNEAADVPINPGTPVRMILKGEGDTFSCQIFDLTDLTTPVAELEVIDSTWPTGTCGIFMVADENDPPNLVDCTFDNYFASTMEPAPSSEIEVVSFQEEGEEFVLEFRSSTGATYALWQSSDLQVWEEIDDSIPASGGFITLTKFDKPEAGTPRKFYQIRRESDE